MKILVISIVLAVAGLVGVPIEVGAAAPEEATDGHPPSLLGATLDDTIQTCCPIYCQVKKRSGFTPAEKAFGECAKGIGYASPDDARIKASGYCERSCN